MTQSKWYSSQVCKARSNSKISECNPSQEQIKNEKKNHLTISINAEKPWQNPAPNHDKNLVNSE